MFPPAESVSRPISGLHVTDNRLVRLLPPASLPPSRRLDHPLKRPGQRFCQAQQLIGGGTDSSIAPSSSEAEVLSADRSFQIRSRKSLILQEYGIFGRHSANR